MGRREWSDRRLVEDCRVLDIAELKRRGLFDHPVGHPFIHAQPLKIRDDLDGIDYWLTEQYPGDLILRITYLVYDCWRGERERISTGIELSTTPCHYGGQRYWFRCPMENDFIVCNRRGAKLYRPPSEQLYACRSCHNLTYQSQKRHDKSVDKYFRNPALLRTKILSGSGSAVDIGVRMLANLMKQELGLG